MKTRSIEQSQDRLQSVKRPRLSIDCSLTSEQTPPYNNYNSNSTTTSSQQQQRLESNKNKIQKLEYATPVSAKPTHVVLNPDFNLKELETESPDVFLLRGGLRVRNVKRSLRDLMPTKGFIHLLEKEVACIPDSNYMQIRQNGHLKPSRRQELVLMMRAISKDFTFHEETLCIAVNYLDRYLSLVKVTMKKQFHLLAIACIYLAAKIYEEVKEPCLPDMLTTTTEDLTVKDLKRMERKVLTALNWEFNTVTPHMIVHEIFNSLRTPDIKDSEISNFDFPTQLGVPSPTTRRDVMYKCQEYFDYLLNEYTCVGIRPSLMAIGVWMHLQNSGLASVMHVTEKQLTALLGKRFFQLDDFVAIEKVIQVCFGYV